MKIQLKNVMFLLFIVLFLGTTTNFAKSGLNLGFNGIGGHIGYVMPEDPIDNTLDFGVQADLGNYNNQIFFTAFVDYWSKSYNTGNYEWSYSVTTLGLLGKYYFKETSGFKPYVGAGPDFIISSWESKYKGPDYGYIFDLNLSDSDSKIGIDIAAGADKKLSDNMKLYAEAKYHIGGIDQFVINVGVTYLLGKK